MLDTLDRESSLFIDMKKNDSGVDRAAIEGAEAIHIIFKRLGINPEDVEKIHRKSDIRGLTKLINAADRKRQGIANQILIAGTTSTVELGAARLKNLARMFGKRK